LATQASRNPKNLRRVIQRNGLVTPLMVGDAEGDEAAARACRVRFAFCEYGFGQVVGPDFRLQTFSDLRSMLGEIAA